MEKMLLLMLLILGLFVSSSQNATCYQCQGSFPDCGDPFIPNKPTCKGDVCYKSKNKVTGKVAFISSVVGIWH